MHIERPHAAPSTPKETQQLERLETVIKNAVADGKISRKELDDIRAVTFANKTVTMAELTLYKNLVLDKIESGELQYDW